MTLTQFPDCCGAALLSGFDTYPGRIYYMQPERMVEALKKAILARLQRYKGRYTIAITAASENGPEVVPALQACGFKRLDSFNNRFITRHDCVLWGRKPQ